MQDRASFRGIFFYVDTVEMAKEWHHKTHEYISDHPIDTTRYKRAAETFPICGFLLGKGALLTRDLLLKACQNPKPGKLFHPLFGFKDVVCVSIRIESIEDTVNFYRIQMTFKEALSQKNLRFAELLGNIEKVHDQIDKLAMQFIEAMSTVHELSYAFERSAQMLTKLDGFLHDINGIGLFPELRKSAIDLQKQMARHLISILRSPQTLFDKMKVATKQVKSSQAVSFLEKEPVDHPIMKTFALLMLFEHSEDLPYTNLVERLMEVETHDEIFAFLWDLSLKLPAPTMKQKSFDFQGIPSLVAAYERYNDLEKAREIADAARQPFYV